jgi:hypothetical protein
MACSGENKEDTKMNEVLNENMLENITPSDSPTMVQQSLLLSEKSRRL